MRQRDVNRRACVAVAALVLHGILFLVALLVRTPPGVAPSLPQFVSLWLTEPAPRPTAQDAEAPAPSADLGTVEPAETSVANPVQQADVAAPQPEAPKAPAATIDWMREGSLVAEASRGTADGKSRIQRPRPTMREGCVPKETSFKVDPERKGVGFKRMRSCDWQLRRGARVLRLSLG